MHHKCVHCGKIYQKGSEEIIKGCGCGGRLFYFVRDKTKKDNDEIEYFYELEDDANNELIVFDVETINVKNGKYEIDVDRLMKGDKLIYQYDEGKYSIDLKTGMKK